MPGALFRISAGVEFSTPGASASQVLTIHLRTQDYFGNIRVTVNDEEPVVYLAPGGYDEIGEFTVEDGDVVVFEALDDVLDAFCASGSGWTPYPAEWVPAITPIATCDGLNGVGSMSIVALASEMEAAGFDGIVQFTPFA